MVEYPCFESRSELVDAVNEFQVLGGRSKAVQTYGPIKSWCTSKITDMSSLFYMDASFHADLSDWDVSNVTDMNFMFHSAFVFDGGLESWDVSNVKNMSHMFSYSMHNDLGLSNWNVTNVENFNSMFQHSTIDLDLSKWDVSNARTMNQMFAGATFFNSDLSLWDVSNVIDMTEMFSGAESFNQSLCEWGKKLKNPNDVDFDLFHGLSGFSMFESTGCVQQGNPNLMSSPFGPFCIDCRAAFSGTPTDLTELGNPIYNSGQSGSMKNSEPSGPTDIGITEQISPTGSFSSSSTATEKEPASTTKLKITVVILTLIFGAVSFGFISMFFSMYHRIKVVLNENGVIGVNRGNQMDLNNIM